MAFGYARTMRPALLLLIFCLPAWLTATEVYKSVQPDGSVIYSDRPAPDATPVTIEPPPTLPVAPPRPEGPAAPPPEEAAPAPRPVDYQAIDILAPGEDSVVRDNPGNVTITVQLQPELQADAGHRLAVILDGSQLQGRFTGNRLSLANVDRGTHSVVVVVVDGQGKVLARSAPRIFHMKRHSILNP